jgi:hypothetical protein
MIRYDVTNIASGLITNSWTSDFADGTYYEVGFGAKGADAVLDADGSILVPAVIAEYTVTATDISGQIAKEAAYAYLAETDWMAIRCADNGIAIPDDVKAKRNSARITIAPDGVTAAAQGGGT